jgi:hypothetical protein
MMSGSAQDSGPSMTIVSPSAANGVLRLGWMMAEVYGRLRPDLPERLPLPPRGSEQTEVPKGFPLSLAGERTPIEYEIEATKVLAELARRAEASLPLSTLSYHDKIGPLPYRYTETPEVLEFLVAQLLRARYGDLDVRSTLGVADQGGRDDPNEQTAWERLVWFLWAWDAVLQDRFAAGDFGTSSAYQLGRGLSESFWNLNPDAGSGPSSWSVLFGPARVEAFRVLCLRLSPAIGGLASVAVRESVKGWAEVASAPEQFQYPRRALSEQALIWKDLLVTGRDPLTMVPTGKLEWSARRLWPLISAYRVELASGVIGAFLLALSVTQAGRNVLTALGAAIGVFGITGSVILGRLKAVAQSVNRRVREGMNEEEVIKAVTHLPQRGHSPTFRSAESASFTVGSPGHFRVVTDAKPAPAFSYRGSLPGGLSFRDNGDGTALLDGTPAPGTAGIFPVMIVASNDVSEDVTQAFSLTVYEAARIVTPNEAAFAVGTAALFRVEATGYPRPRILLEGTLPTGVTSEEDGQGRVTLSGTPLVGTARTYVLTIIASNNVAADARQRFTLTVRESYHL